MDFFRATEDKGKYAKASERYERLVIKDAMGKHEYYIERRPAHVVSRYAVETVLVTKTRKYGNSPEEQRALAEEVFGTKSKSSKRNTDYPRGFTYSLTCRIASKESKRLIRFNDTNLKQSFEVKIGGRSIGVLDFELPFEPDTSHNKYVEFTIPLLEDDADRIKELLSPFSGKVIWE